MKLVVALRENALFGTLRSPVISGLVNLNCITTIAGVAEKTQLCRKLNLDRSTLSFVFSSAYGIAFHGKSLLLHPVLEESAWTLFLQSALVLGLWSGRWTNHRQRRRSPFSLTATDTERSKSWLPILLSFLIGAVGSFIGGLLGHFVASSLNTSTNLTSLIPADALSVVAAALTASYIGGTVNFFETAKVLGAASNESKKALINLVAGVDIGVMVLYFSLLSFLRRSPIARRLLQPEEEEQEQSKYSSNKPIVHGLFDTHSAAETGDAKGFTGDAKGFTEGFSPIFPLPGNDDSSLPSIPIQMAAAGSVGAITASTLIAVGSTRIQRASGVAGVSVMCATIMGLFMGQMFDTILAKVSSPTSIDDKYNDGSMGGKDKTNVVMSRVRSTARDAILGLYASSSEASAYMMGLFYSAIGLNSGLLALPSVGKPLLTLIAIALLVHLTAIIGGSWAWNRMMNVNSPLRSKYRIDADTALVASNACVGGAATAAQMASAMSRPDLVLGASAVGTLGYTIGTPIALYLAKILIPMKR